MTELEEVTGIALWILRRAGVPWWVLVLAASALAVLYVLAPKAWRWVVAHLPTPEPQVPADENGPAEGGVTVTREGDPPPAGYDRETGGMG